MPTPTSSAVATARWPARAAAAAAGVFLSSCTLMPSDVIRVRDASGRPLADFPLRLQVSEGMKLLSRGESGVALVREVEVKSDRDGTVAADCHFPRSQPSVTEQLVFRRSRLPSRALTVIPLRELPAGASITIPVPNP
jgi:hypothetical protein